MDHTLPLPTRRYIRAILGANISAWARSHGLPPHAVHATLHRYAGGEVDMARSWGPQTRRVLLALHEAVQAAAERGAA
ncbi:MAG: hypothetical protein OXC11_12275 [Rhodospirillales bacterium]|nr:hypothetical protein [Rhodospirillales bacterium]